MHIMRVAVVGATGVMGRSAVAALIEAGHSVVALARSPEKAALIESLGARPHPGSLLDHDGLVEMLDGVDALCNLARRVPSGRAAARQHSWRNDDRLRSEGVRRVVAAVREAHVRRIVHASVSYQYADQGDAWIDEDSPLAITRATEPASVGEAHVQDYCCDSRVAVVLRFGTVLGDDPHTRLALRHVRHGHPIGLGDPDGWAHVLHTEDVGGAVVTALGAPGGIYNVGAEPVRRADLLAGFAEAAGREHAAFLGPLTRRLGRVRLEPLGRSLRVSSERFTLASGWVPSRPRFDASWLTDVALAEAVR